MKNAILRLLREYFLTANTLRYRVEWPRVKEALSKIPPVETLFDGGAGSGEFLRRCLQSGFAKKVIALEYDAGNYGRLEGNLGSDSRARLIRGSLLEIPLEDASVDTVMSTQVIEHIQDHEKAASELVRILKPGGHALISVPHPPEPFPNDDHMREGYTEADLTALFAPLGMKPLHTDYFLTRGTTDRLLSAWKLPLRGMFLPVALVDAETKLTAAERKAGTPFGILTLFRKEG